MALPAAAALRHWSRQWYAAYHMDRKELATIVCLGLLFGYGPLGLGFGALALARTAHRHAVLWQGLALLFFFSMFITCCAVLRSMATGYDIVAQDREDEFKQALDELDERKEAKRAAAALRKALPTVARSRTSSRPRL